jgi:hypothetical protein
MSLSNSGVVFVALLVAVLGVAAIVVVVFRFKKPRAGLRASVVAPAHEADKRR